MRALALLLFALLATACGSSGRAPTTTARRTARPTPARRATRPSTPQALVTEPGENELIVVDLPSGRVVRRVSLPATPEYVATSHSGAVVVTSAGAGAVTVLDRATLRASKVFGGFDQPHIVEISPDASYAYVTDDASGRLAVIGLHDDKLLSRVDIGPGAHHLTFSPGEHRVWVALGMAATTIEVLSSENPARPRRVGQLDPGFEAHQPLFSPDGREIWITSAAGPDVGVFSARDDRLRFRVPGGSPPQHVAFDGRFAYITSGYGSSIEKVTLSGRLVRRVGAPYGSFELDAADGFVVTASLLRGTLAIYNTRLHLLRTVHLAPSLEDVVISSP